MKVLIAMGTCRKFSYCEEEVTKSILNQTYTNFDFLIVDNSKDLIYSIELRSKYPAEVIHINRQRYFRDSLGTVRKAIKDYAVSRGYDYLFCVDADMVIPLDALEKLIKHEKDFVTGVIGYNHDPQGRTTCYIAHDKQNKVKITGQKNLKALLFSELKDLTDIKEIISCGLSCYLIKVNHLIGMDFYISHSQMDFLEDRTFCRDLTQKGVRLWLNPTILPLHLHVRMNERYLRQIN